MSLLKTNNRNVSFYLEGWLIEAIDDYKYQNRMSRTAVVKKALKEFFEKERCDN